MSRRKSRVASTFEVNFVNYVGIICGKIAFQCHTLLVNALDGSEWWVSGVISLCGEDKNLLTLQGIKHKSSSPWDSGLIPGIRFMHAL
jgi:hypothetical protein